MTATATATALCATLLPTVGDLWFSTDPAQRRTAKWLCRRCPLAAGCETAGLSRPDERGVWGALDSGDRDRLRGIDQPNPDNDGEPPARGRRPCGTEAAYKAHRMRGERCTRCTRAHARRVREARRERLAQAHTAGGTAWGYGLHRLLGEAACEACTAAAVRRAGRGRGRRLRAVPSPAGGRAGGDVAEPEGAAA